MLDGLSNPHLKNPKKKSVQTKDAKFNWKTFGIIIAVILTTAIITYFTGLADLTKNKFNILKQIYSGKYLVLFQNNTELRPTGGFIGSFAVVDTKLFKIDNVYFNTNIYKQDDKYEYALKKEMPEPLKEHIGGYWTMRDSNWAINYPDAAKTISWFYKNEGGQDVDGVIAVNASVVQDLLNLIGSINLSQYNLTINSGNFFSVLQKQIEKDYFLNEQNKTTNEPKTILKDMYPIVMQKIKNLNFRQEIMPFIVNELNHKQILVYFKNPDLEKIVQSKNWGGEVKQTNGDYLYINNANITGGKSSLNISENVTLKSNFNPSTGETIDQLTITRTHTGTGEWPDGDNKNYTRVLVPDGSKLILAQLNNNNISQKDLTTKNEYNKTTFGFWFTTNVGQTNTVVLTYKLPTKLKNQASYSLYLQKQPGSLPDNVLATLNDTTKFSGLLDTDKEIK